MVEMSIQRTSFVITAVLGVILAAHPVLAHCDTADGPVVAAAKVALAKGGVTPVLKWVKPEAESEIKAAFARVLAVRGKGPEAQALADQYFFENLVRGSTGPGRERPTPASCPPGRPSSRPSPWPTRPSTAGTPTSS
jgi:hypothetical protein